MKVILLTIECFRKDCFKKGIVPYLFKMSKESSFFENAYSTGPWTPASFTGILSSYYPLMYNKKPCLSNKVKSIAEVLKEKGYKTACFTGGGWLSQYFNFIKGFDFVYNSNKTYSKKRNLLKAIENLKEKIYDLLPKKIYNKIRRFSRILKSFKDNDVDKIKVKKALSWLEKNKDKNSFMWIHFENSHDAYSIGGSIIERIISIYNSSKEKKDLNKKQIEVIRKMYKEGLKSVDKNIAFFTEKLKEKDKDFLFVVCGDHGQELYDRSFFGHGPKFYQENINVPLILFGKKIEKKNFEKPVSLIGIPPTILEVLNEKKEKDFLGKSLFKKSMIISEDAREKTIMPPELNKIKYNLDHYKAALIEKGYKYIYKNKGKSELYDLKKDNKEKKNLSDAEKEIAEKMKKKIQKHIKFEKKTRENKKSAWKKGDKERVRQRLRELGYT